MLRKSTSLFGLLFVFIMPLITVGFLTATEAQAITVEPGSLRASGFAGPAFKISNQLGGSGANLTLGGGLEYSVSSNISFVGDFSLGLAGTNPMRLRAGGRYRFTGLGLPVSPYAQAELSFAYLIDVINSNIPAVGIRTAGGADYFLTKEMSVGAQIGLDLARTITDYPVTFGNLDFLAVATYLL
ncbi:hypothetical protein KAI87_16390 [Myxococcota bacterium]|nr:hypothetical protein [Myxococcota bacterium]